MALISRIQISNYLDSSKRLGWRPDFVGETLDIAGLPAAVVMDNGTGKTSLAEAVLWLLSQDSALRKNIAPKVAPHSYGHFTHIRVEFVVPRRVDTDIFAAMGQHVDGDLYVFGAYLFREKGEGGLVSHLYHYHGSLEDVPVYVENRLETGEYEKGLMSDDDFLAGFPKEYSIARKSDWLSKIDSFIPRKQLLRIADYQKRGGGDKSASLYNITLRGRETFDMAFFREHVAPEILADIIEDESAEGQQKAFERNIVEHADAVVQAKLATDKKRTRLDLLEAARKDLEDIAAAASSVVEAKKTLGAIQKRFTTAISDLRSMVNTAAISGLPVPTDRFESLPEDVRFILQNSGFYQSDIAIRPPLLNKYATGRARQEPHNRAVSQFLPISIPSKDAGIRIYPMAGLPLAETDPNEELRQSMLALIEETSAIVCEYANHPLRSLLISRKRLRKKNEVRIQTIEKTRIDLIDEREKLLARIDDYGVNERAFTTMAASGLFSEQELAEPVATGKAVGVAVDAAEKALLAHHTRVARLASDKDDYDEAAQEFGANRILEILDEMEGALEEAKAAESESRQQHDMAVGSLAEKRSRATVLQGEEDEAVRSLGSLEDESRNLDEIEVRFGTDIDPRSVIEVLSTEIAQAENAANDIRAEIKVKRAKFSTLASTLNGILNRIEGLREASAKLEGLQSSYLQFSTLFPDNAPLSFERDKRRTISDARVQIASLQGEMADHAKLFEALRGFRSHFADDVTVDPSTWLKQVAEERRELANKLHEIKASISESEARLSALMRGEAAPTTADAEALSILDDIGIKHRFLHDFLSDSVKDEQDRKPLLSQFSAILFAPVVETPEQAERAAAAIAELDLPVPVLLAQDVLSWTSKEPQVPVRTTGKLSHGILAGIATRKVDLILDPHLIEREIDRERGILDELSAQKRGVEERLLEIDSEGRLVATARLASKALEQNSEMQIEKLSGRIHDLSTQIDDIESHLTPENISLAQAASRYLENGGDDELGRVTNKLAECEAEQSEVKEESKAVGAAIDHLEGVDLVSAEKRYHEAISERYWIERCERAAEFVSGGGRDTVMQARVHLGDIKTKRVALAHEVSDLEVQVSKLSESLEIARSHRTSCNLRQSQWERCLNNAVRLVESGDLDFLLEADDIEGRLEARKKSEAARSAFDFAAAGEHVSLKGTDVDEMRQRSVTIKVEISELDAEKEVAQKTLPRLDHEIQSLETVCENSEGHLRYVFSEFQKAGDVDIPNKNLAPDSNDMSPELRALEGRIDAAIAAFSIEGNDVAASIVEIEAAYEALRDYVEDMRIGNARVEIKQNQNALEAAERNYLNVIDRNIDGNSFDNALKASVRQAKDAPEGVAAILEKHNQGISHELQIWEEARKREEESRKHLTGILKGHVIAASQNLDTMKTAMRPIQDNAGFILEADIAGSSDIDRMVEDIVQMVENRRKRAYDDAKSGLSERDETELVESLSSAVRTKLYSSMFPGARIKVSHPAIGNGHPFYFDKGVISGGQATALTLMWTIKVAAYAVERSARKHTGVARSRIREASHSIILVDGLFSDLSEPNLIKESMEAMKMMRGNFQLIGLIHSPYYRNDWELFPTCIVGRRKMTSDSAGPSGSIVSFAPSSKGDGGSVSLSGLRARNTLRESA